MTEPADDTEVLTPHAAWGTPLDGLPDGAIAGTDAQLARAAARQPGAVLAYRPAAESDLGLTLGLHPENWPDEPSAIRPLDGIDLGPLGFALNAVVLGPAPERIMWGTTHRRVRVEVDGRKFFVGAATTIVIASGQYVHGVDLVPKGHPGDGKLEVQVYALVRSERAAMRRRLAQGAHVPHPRIKETRGLRIFIESRGTWPIEVDGESGGAANALTAEVVPAALNLAV